MNSPPSKSRERYSLPSPASNGMGIAHWCERDSASTHLSKRPHPSPLASRVSTAISSRPQILRASFSRSGSMYITESPATRNGDWELNSEVVLGFHRRTHEAKLLAFSAG